MKKVETIPWIFEEANTGERREVTFGAVTSVPRLSFTTHSGVLYQAFDGMQIPVIKVTGYGWGACLQRGINVLIESGCDYIITIDGDSVFQKEDILELLLLAARYEDADAILPWQVRRGGYDELLVLVRDSNNEPVKSITAGQVQDELVPVAGGHFGLTLIKVSALLKTPKPWFWDVPNADGEWEDGKTDADIYFWNKFREAGNKACLATDVRIGHIDEEILWPNAQFGITRQNAADYHEKGKPNLGPQPVRLNLGAGGSPIDGYENIDLKNGKSAFPLKYADGTVDEVRASHILEHFPHGEVEAVVREWARVLKPGGKLKVAVPDFDYIVKEYSNGHRGDPLLEAYLFGGQVDADDYHKTLFNEDKLKTLLEIVGLTDVRRWEADANDCSALAVSLNLQGVKNHADEKHRETESQRPSENWIPVDGAGGVKRHVGAEA
jgi:predicted SAM-dependent methyltransferase